MVERSLRILQVSTADFKGGAEKVAWNLFTAYRARGYPSWLAVGQKNTSDPDVMLLPNHKSRGKWYDLNRQIACQFQHTNGSGGIETPLSGFAGALAEPKRCIERFLGWEDFHFPGTAQLLKLTDNRVDILHAHNLHGGYFDLRMLPRLSKQVPLLLTLHDAWLLSGHCAHSFACEKWKTGCGACPDLTIYPEVTRDATAFNWHRKQDIYSRSRLYIATPSRWLMKKVEQSILAPGVMDARILPNGIELNIFHPADKQTARAQLGIRNDANVILTMGVSIKENKWKDFQTVRQAVQRVAEQLNREYLLLLALGQQAPTEWSGNLEIRFLPFQVDQETIARYLQAADLYVHAARADTFPNAVLEAQACGTPVVATHVGGIPEQVEENRTGFLVPTGDAEELAARIIQLLSDTQLRYVMGRLAADHASQRFGLERQVEAYVGWYHELVKRKA
jgi:glycosyltransferase involved in cell wall biosynthesis